MTRMLAKVTILLTLLRLGLSLEDRAMCSRNRSMIETPGDAVLSLFLDINHGPYCNVTSAKGLQEITTAFYVAHALNKYEFIPGLSLGLKVFDTCHDEMTVFKQSLQAAVDSDCTDRYEMGILLPSEYNAILEPIRNYSVLPISTYEDQNLTKPLLNLMVHYLSTRFEIVDLLLVDSEFALNFFLDATKEAGICVKNYAKNVELDEGDTEAVIAVIGGRNDARQWIEKGEKLQGPRKTWIVLPLDGSNVDDLIPLGSYVVRTPPFNLDLLQDVSSTDDFLAAAGNTVIHSSHLLGVGKAVFELAQVLQDLQRRNCPRRTETTCLLPRFNPHTAPETRNSDVYNALRILPRLHSIKYIVAMRTQQELIDMATYRVEPANLKFRVTPESRVPKMPKLCLKKYARNCEDCLNFKKRFGARGVITDTLDRGLLKSGNWIPIFLTVVVCGTFACGVIAVFIIYRFIAEDVLDGNPALTIVLILANIFTLLTVLPFCINDYYVGAEALNSRKILVTTLAFGIDFSVMLSRAFFLVFSKGGVFTAHINGYLQGLMVFFMFGVQFAISIMFFVLSDEDSAVVARSLLFIALLGYDIFLLVTLFVVCFFIARLPRNYREGKCFFGTSIGLLITWAIWLTCFILVEPECRDMVVSFGIVATAYLIIIGVLVPRTYYMVTHLARGKEYGQRFGSTDLGHDPRINSIMRQTRPFYDYVHPAGGSVTNLQVAPAYPNYYGSSSPNQKYLTHSRSPDSRRIPGYNNYGFHTEMREVNNAYKIPQVCIEDADSRTSPGERSSVNSAYARPKCHRKKKTKNEKDFVETDVYVESNHGTARRSHDEMYPVRSVSPRLTQMEATIREEDEEDNVTRITRF
ncbi:protein bride of sevenless isoform X1 [Hylaeus volcanicus]|uniref:protein bride of sevenless isoform X1 n=1 Tax=Hylaeus volcanicus TaxID=313075 RepID=UPI0023B82C8E|nr:protein bride of sevenless isoform X1 [Hylaeus volcanicus]